MINSTELHLSKQNLENADSQLKKLEKERDTLLMQLAVLCGLSLTALIICKGALLQRLNIREKYHPGSFPTLFIQDPTL